MSAEVKSQAIKMQEQMDCLVKRRTYWRLMFAALTDSKTKEIFTGLSARIKAKADEYVIKYDNAKPEDAVTIAKCQEGRLLCNTLLKEMDEATCKHTLDDLDRNIKVLSDEIRKEAAKPATTGFC